MNCPHCGELVDPVEGQKYCTFCGGNLETAQSDSETTASNHGPQYSVDLDRPHLREEYCPWEDQDNLGFFSAIGQTVQETLFRPREFFSRIPLRGGFVQPLLYGLIIGTLGEMIGLLWFFSTNGSFLEKFSALGNWEVLLAVLVPVSVFIRMFVTAAIFHVSLYLFGGARQDLEATFRVTCYSSAPELCSIIPILGGFAGTVWKLYVIIIGISSVHETSLGRSTLAVLVPFVVCCAMLVGVFLVTLASIGVAAG